MPYRVVKFHGTPNPNALRLQLDRVVPPLASPALRSYSDPDRAAQDDLARRLMGVVGVANLLIQNDWITVGKLPQTPWATLKPALAKALGDAP